MLSKAQIINLLYSNNKQLKISATYLVKQNCKPWFNFLPNSSIGCFLFYYGLLLFTHAEHITLKINLTLGGWFFIDALGNF